MGNRPRGRIVILGQNSLQNQLLRKLIGEHAHFECELVDAASAAHLSRIPLAPGLPQIVLIDTLGPTLATMNTLLEDLRAREAPPAVAFINSGDGDPVEQFVDRGAVRGIFHRDTAPDDMLRGLAAILDGEYWFPRKLLNAYLDRTRGPQADVEPQLSSLTPRELQVLDWLAGGASNAVIAERLHVTQHTVKSHLYRLFRKIHADNRVQAALWARKHLQPRR